MFAPLAAALLLTNPIPAKRWVYLMTNLLVDANVDSALTLAERAKKAGYTGIVVSDSKFCRWDSVPERYLTNVKRFSKGVKDDGLDLIVAVAPIGYANDLLSRDPNLAEGLPVSDAPFAAQPDGTLVPVADDAGFKNGGFESTQGSSPSGWSWVDEPGKVCVLDHDVMAEGATSLRMDDAGGGNARACQTLKVEPFRYYHVRLSVKTEDFDGVGNAHVTILGKSGQGLQYRSLPVQRTMDWTPIDVTFNTLDNHEVNFYIGVWGMKGGHIWWDDLHLEPGGLVNLVRRPGAPFIVKSADGKTTYTEGKDFDGAKDPKMGNAAWPGDYDAWHTPPRMSLPAGSQIHHGDRVLVSYCHTAMIYDGQVTCCLGEPALYDIIRWQIQQVHKYMQPSGYLLSHDEIRVGGWDTGCTKDGRTPGQLLADNVKKCVAMVRAEDPGKMICVWSDMFDPYHNASPAGSYYLLKGQGPWKDSWLGLDEDVVVLNWNMQEGKRQQSLKFFDMRGQNQILAGYYDGGGTPIDKWMKEAGRPYGVMYTTWQGQYKDLERFAHDWAKP